VGVLLESPLAAHAATPEELQARMEMSRAGSPFLLLRHPDGQQVLMVLSERTRVTVGRRAESDIALQWDTRVSRLHAELTMVGNDWVITDDGLSDERDLGGREPSHRAPAPAARGPHSRRRYVDRVLCAVGEGRLDIFGR
jgi:pSer/pThr/pTyr-binding forkhead associated (FHA) protein